MHLQGIWHPMSAEEIQAVPSHNVKTAHRVPRCQLQGPLLPSREEWALSCPLENSVYTPQAQPQLPREAFEMMAVDWMLNVVDWSRPDIHGLSRLSLCNPMAVHTQCYFD